MDYYKTIKDFPNESYIVAFIYSVASASPLFFTVFLFFLWIFGTGSSYYAILRATGKKRFFQVALSFSIACFVLSLLFISLNGEVEVLNGYWTIFYALMSGLAYLGLSFYK